MCCCRKKEKVKKRRKWYIRLPFWFLVGFTGVFTVYMLNLDMKFVSKIYNWLNSYHDKTEHSRDIKF